jgi:hypothetical protein
MAGKLPLFGPLLLTILLCACGGDEAEPAAVADRAEIDRLRALPYVGSTPIEKGDEETGVVLLDERRSYPGYMLYTVQDLGMAELIDHAGNVVRAWSDPQGARWERSELLPNGDLLVIGADNSAEPAGSIPDDSRYLARLDWEGRLLWKRQATVHHDIEMTPSGHLLVLTFVRRQIPAIHPTLDIRDDQITLLDAEGNPLDSLSLLDAFKGKADIHPLETPGPTALGVRPWIDILHSNSLEGMPFPHLEGRHPIYTLGNVLICSRHQDIVTVVDWRTRKAIWAWGAGELVAPHDAHFLNNGNILIFDNGLGRGWSRVIELDPVNETIVWEYRAPDPADFYSRTKGSCQRLPNDNTLIADSDNGRAFEVTQGGDVVWEFVCPHQTEPGRRAAIVRARLYDREFIENLAAQAGI